MACQVKAPVFKQNDLSSNLRIEMVKVKRRNEASNGPLTFSHEL